MTQSSRAQDASHDSVKGSRPSNHGSRRSSTAYLDLHKAGKVDDSTGSKANDEGEKGSLTPDLVLLVLASDVSVAPFECDEQASLWQRLSTLAETSGPHGMVFHPEEVSVLLTAPDSSIPEAYLLDTPSLSKVAGSPRLKDRFKLLIPEQATSIFMDWKHEQMRLAQTPAARLEQVIADMDRGMVQETTPQATSVDTETEVNES